MKCNECDQKAVWLVTDLSGSDKYLLPLCEEHFQEVREMEGEMNLDFEYLEDALNSSWQFEKIVKEINQHNQAWEKRYQNVLSEYSAMRKFLKIPPGPLPSEILACNSKKPTEGNK